MLTNIKMYFSYIYLGAVALTVKQKVFGTTFSMTSFVCTLPYIDARPHGLFFKT